MKFFKMCDELTKIKRMSVTDENNLDGGEIDVGRKLFEKPIFGHDMGVRKLLGDHENLKIEEKRGV
jgi:hypothetical protein